MKKIILLLVICISNGIHSQDWGEQILNQPNTGTSYSFGFSVAIDGDYAVIGSPGETEWTGSAHIYKKNDEGIWIYHQRIEDHIRRGLDNFFGYAVAIEGDYIFVSVYKDRIDEDRYEKIAGSVIVFKKDANDVWNPIQKIRSSDIRIGDEFGIDIAVEGNFLVVGATNQDYDENDDNSINGAGAVYVFERNNNDVYNQVQKLIPSNRDSQDNIGKSVGISGDYIIFSSKNDTDAANANPIAGNGSVFVFKRDNIGVWNETQKIKPINGVNYSRFAFEDISIFGDYIAVGATGIEHLENNNWHYGFVYLFKKDNNDVWNETQILRIPNTAYNFGYEVVLDHNRLLISAPNSNVSRDGDTNYNVGKSYLFTRNVDDYLLTETLETSIAQENSYVGAGKMGNKISSSAIALKDNQFILGANNTKRTIADTDYFLAGRAYISGNINDFFGQTITWTGAISTDWNTAGNWDINSVPTATDNVILADVVNAPRINFDQSHAVKDLTIDENLTIKTNASLTINGNLDHGANIQVESFANGNGSFILRGNQTNLNPADLIYLRYVNGINWHMVSSPVTNFDIDVFAAATNLAEGQGNNRGIGFYNNNANPRWSYYQAGANDTGDFIAGKGYSILTSETAFLNFTGKLKATDLNNYVITENLDGWNLIGNPYPAFINANTNADENDNFLTENADNLDPEFANIYVWNPNTTSYEPIGNGLGAKYIAPAQGFFVKSKVGGGTIDINKSMLTHQQGDLFLKTNPTKKMVLQIKDDTNISETTIAFKNGMTKGLDVTYDAAVFSGATNNLSIYTHLLEDNKNVPFAIQFLPELENNDFIIPLGIYQKEETEITLSLKEIDISDEIKIYLEDKTENTFTEITNDNYQFSHQKEDSETGRFFLHFQQKSLNVDDVSNSKIQIYKSDDATITVLGIPKGTLNIYDITGKEVMKNRKINNLKEQIQVPKLSKGVYLFKVKIGSQQVVKKLIF